MRSLRCLSGVIAALWMLQSARVHARPPASGNAGPSTQPFPCTGCILHEPASYSPDQPAPLLVVLHGDEGSPARIAQVWTQPAQARGVILFAPKCPREQGCTSGSFWRWGASPDWLQTQVAAVVERLRVDDAQVYLSGWSGGATYIGMRAPDLGQPFTALNLNGGGHPPADPARCAPCTLPVYYLAGDRNPLHHLAVSNRKYHEACGHDVTWDLLPGKNHAGELAALSRQEKALAILDWLKDHSRRCDPSGPAAPENRTPAGALDAGMGAPSSPGASAEPPGAQPAAEPPARLRSESALCGCASTAPPQSHGTLLLLFVGAFVARRMLRPGKRLPCGAPRIAVAA